VAAIRALALLHELHAFQWILEGDPAGSPVDEGREEAKREPAAPAAAVVVPPAQRRALERRQ
jgi:hypothetical protein